MLNPPFRSHRLAVSRTSRTSDGQGGWTGTRTQTGAVTGSLQPGGVAEAVAGDQTRAQARWQLLTDPAPPVRRGDELHLVALIGRTGTDTAVVDGPRFTVLDVVDHQAGGRVDHARIDLEQFQTST